MLSSDIHVTSHDCMSRHFRKHVKASCTNFPNSSLFMLGFTYTNNPIRRSCDNNVVLIPLKHLRSNINRKQLICVKKLTFMKRIHTHLRYSAAQQSEKSHDSHFCLGKQISIHGPHPDLIPSAGDNVSLHTAAHFPQTDKT